MIFDKNSRKCASIEINVTFMKPILVNEFILILVESQKIGKTIAFVNASIYLEKNLDIAVTGKQVISLLNDSFFKT